MIIFRFKLNLFIFLKLIKIFNFLLMLFIIKYIEIIFLKWGLGIGDWGFVIEEMV